MELNIPDFMPVLRHGVGEKPMDGGCLMQCASFIAYGAWEDRPECVHDYLNELGIKVNDSVSNEARSGLALTIPDLLNSDDAYQQWESNKEHDAIRSFWADMAFFATMRFREHGVKACSSCLAAINTAEDPSAAARNYARCLVENADGVLWNDPTWDDDMRAECNVPVAGTDKQRELIAIYADIVEHFNTRVANAPVEIAEDKWRELREAMTPEAAPA